jgi:drug/metabolite transporter (DMT)-like permease
MATEQPAQVGPDRATILGFVGVVVLGGLNSIAVKVSVQELAPLWSAGLRFVTAGLLLLGIVLVTRRPLPAGRSLLGAVAYGVTAFAASFGFAYSALRELPAGAATVFLALVPLFTFGLAILQGQERFRVEGLIGAVIALVGLAIVVADQLSAAVPIGSMVLMLVATLCIAESGVILKSIPRSDPFGTNGTAMLAGAVVLLVVSVAGGERWALPVRDQTWLAIAYLVLLGSIVMFGLYLFSLKRWTASAMSYVTLLMPLVTVPVAAWLLAERVSPLLLIGGLVAVGGVYVGAFLVRPNRTSQTALPECLPIDACAEAATATNTLRPVRESS